MLQGSGYSPGWRHDLRLRSMFEARKRVFVDLLKWDLPVVDGRYELDQFDTPDATYLIVSDHDGAHLASARLLPTTEPHILDSLFAHLCQDPLPCGPSIYEITRFCLDRRLHAAERLAARNLLVSAIADHALANGITAYTGVAEFGWLQQILAFGWHCRPLGLPVTSGATTLAALTIEISAKTPELLRQAGVYCVAEEEHRHAA